MNCSLRRRPELTLHQSGKYVAGAYIVFLAIVLIYVAIMAVRQRRTEREPGRAAARARGARASARTDEAEATHDEPRRRPGR